LFLDHLTPREKEGFLELALLAIRADNSISDEEVQAVEELRLELGMDEATFVAAVKRQPNFERAISAFTTREARRRAFLELVTLTFVDGEYDPSENAFLQKTQRALEVEDAVRDRCFAWALQMVKLRDEALAIMVD
jgi:tellurite resistance protein